jgi:hypothetical protein
MAAVTAAVVAGVATVAATGMSVAGGMGGGGDGGAAKDPNFKPVPEDPQDRAMRDYYARALVANATKTYPAFSEYLQSGGAAEKAKFPLEMPGMKPSEAAALGITGPRGEAIPYVTPEAAAAAGGRLSPEQILYLAQERRRDAAQRGKEAGPWATKVGRLGGRIGRLESRLEKFLPTPEIEPREERIQAKLEKLRGKQETLLHPQAPTPR